MTTKVLVAGATILLPGCAAQPVSSSARRLSATRKATTPQASPSATPRPRATPSPTALSPQARGKKADATLAAALAPVLRDYPGALAVGVIDQTTGVTVSYHTRLPFDTASIIKVDILAILLMNHQKTGTYLSSYEQQLATEMIENSDNDAATALWDADDKGSGLVNGNAVLGLHDTWPDPNGAWGLTTTTVADQLQLLTDLTSAHSPLDAASQSYELGLMREVEDDQSWGVTAAAAPGSSPAVKNGWLPLSAGWVINSVGIVTHAGHRLLIVVLSDGQYSEASGISQAQAVAKIAADTAVAA